MLFFSSFNLILFHHFSKSSLSSLITNLERVSRADKVPPPTVYKKPLALFSKSPVTGFFRDGYCRVGPQDGGNHAIAGIKLLPFPFESPEHYSPPRRARGGETKNDCLHSLLPSLLILLPHLNSKSPFMNLLLTNLSRRLNSRIPRF